MKKKIFVVDDEPDIVELVSINLKKDGFLTKGFYDAKSLFQHLYYEIPDLIILDLMLPDIDGIEVCKKLRERDKYSDIPIIMLTAKGEEVDKILGLEMGADDYITKPFSPRELTARVKAVLRRSERKDTKKIINIDNIIKIDLQKYEVFVNNKRINLTTTEFKILEKLAEKRGWVFSREQLLDYLWGNEKIVVDRTIDVHIKHLREKLGKYRKLIKNIRGVGYKLE